jgi:hypothetical protein
MRRVQSTVASGALALISFVFSPSVEAYAHAGTSSGDNPQVDGRASDNVATPARCPGELRLVASVVNEARPQLSLAVVRKPAGARVLPIGGRLDDLTLVELTPHYAGLRAANGVVCVLPVFDPSARTAAPEVRKPASKPREPARETSEAKAEAKSRAHLTQDELTRGLSALGNGEYAISRELLLKALKNPGGAAAGAHFRLAERDGKSVGMEMRGVREGSTLSRMGMKTGDVVQTINGIDVTNPLGMMDALRMAREADGFTITIMREGRPQALRYSVR